MNNLRLLAKIIHSNQFYHNDFEFQRFTLYMKLRNRCYSTHFQKEEILLKIFKKITTLDEIKETISSDNYPKEFENEFLMDIIDNKSVDIFEYMIPMTCKYGISSKSLSRIIQSGNVDKLRVLFEYIKQIKGEHFSQNFVRWPLLLEFALKVKNWKMIKFINSHAPLLNKNIMTHLYNEENEKYSNYIIATNKNYSYPLLDLLKQISHYSANKMRLVLYKQKMRSLRKIVKVSRVKEFLLQKVVWGPNSSYIKRIYENY